MAETLLNIISYDLIDEIYVVAHPDYIDQTNEVIDLHVPYQISGVIPGGETRHESVANALGYFEEKEEDGNALIAIFDGDRPGVSMRIIEENFREAEIYGAAVTAMRSTDSVFLSSNAEMVDEYLDRNTVYLAQTPQTFRLSLILKAYQLDAIGTDDASLVASLGERVQIVEGEALNVKITYPEDLESYLSRRRS